ncbi:transporter substrate-binding domain-containing protein [Micrococcales bacterium 31B]|nr:transporter substrate-binding domain-containing protein [Micrococcales bacterium 31B]
MQFSQPLSRRLALGTLAAGALAALAACGSDSSSSGGTTLKIGTEGTYSPFSFHDLKDGNKLTGYDIEVMDAIAKKMGKTTEYVETAWDSIFAGLDSKRFDIVANQVTVNDERKAKYLLSTPYTVSGGVVLVKSDNTSITKLADLQGKTLAQSATSNWAQSAKDAGASVEAIPGLAEAVTLVKQGRVDGTFNDELAVLNYIATTGDKEVKIAFTTTEKSSQALALRKDDAANFALVDDALKALLADGTIAGISTKWFGKDVSK